MLIIFVSCFLLNWNETSAADAANKLSIYEMHKFEENRQQTDATGYCYSPTAELQSASQCPYVTIASFQADWRHLNRDDELHFTAVTRNSTTTSNGRLRVLSKWKISLKKMLFFFNAVDKGTYRAPDQRDLAIGLSLAQSRIGSR